MAMAKWSAKILVLTLLGLIIASSATAGPSICGVPIIQSDVGAADQASLPPNLPRLSNVAITPSPAAAPIRPDAPVVTSAAAPEAVERAVIIAMARYPKVKSTLVRSDPIAEKIAFVSSRSSKVKDVSIIERAPSGGLSCN